MIYMVAAALTGWTPIINAEITDSSRKSAIPDLPCFSIFFSPVTRDSDVLTNALFLKQISFAEHSSIQRKKEDIASCLAVPSSLMDRRLPFSSHCQR